MKHKKTGNETSSIDRLRRERDTWKQRAIISARVDSGEAYGFDWSVLDELSRAEDIENAARDVYEYAKIAVNQIICLGGEETCQPCENRESLAVALNTLRLALKVKNSYRAKKKGA